VLAFLTKACDRLCHFPSPLLVTLGKMTSASSPVFSSFFRRQHIGSPNFHRFSLPPSCCFFSSWKFQRCSQKSPPRGPLSYLGIKIPCDNFGSVITFFLTNRRPDFVRSLPLSVTANMSSSQFWTCHCVPWEQTSILMMPGESFSASLLPPETFSAAFPIFSPFGG